MSLLCKEWCVVVVVVVLLGIFTTKCLSQSTSGTLCPRVSGRPSCVCQSSKGIIDLTPIANKDKPRFTDIIDPGDHKTKYTFNPCYQVKATEDCTHGYACSEYSGETYSYGITGNVEEIYINTNGTPYLYYPGLGVGSVKVNLQCIDDKDPKIVSNGQNEQVVCWSFTLSSCQVCPGGCANKKAAVASGYIGIAVILLFLILIAVYFIGGGIFLRVRKGPDSGLVPHKHFWKEVPILIKDGCVLTFTGAKSLLTCGSNRDSYANFS